MNNAEAQRRIQALEAHERRRQRAANPGQDMPPELIVVGGQIATTLNYPIVKSVTTEITSIGTNTLPNLATFDPTSQTDAATLSYPDGLGIVRNIAGSKVFWVVNDPRSYTYAFGFADIFVPLRQVSLDVSGGGRVLAYVGYV